MRFKYYLRGLGLGILVSTMILMISVHLRGGVMTDERVVERAMELGMVIPTETDTASGESQESEQEETEQQETEQQETEQQETQKQQTQQQETQQQETQQQEIQQQETQQQETQQQEIEQLDSDITESTPENMEYVIFVVEDGEVCRTAAEKLVAFGLIDDVKEFREFMSERNYDGLIREGTYEIPIGADMETIAKIITAQME